MVSRKNAHFKRQIAELSQSGSMRDQSILDPNHTNSHNNSSVSSGLSAPNNTVAIQSISHNYSKDSFAHHSNSGSVLPPLLQASSEPLKTDLVALFVDRYVPVPDEEAIAMLDEINDFLEVNVLIAIINLFKTNEFPIVNSQWSALFLRIRSLYDCPTKVYKLSIKSMYIL